MRRPAGSKSEGADKQKERVPGRPIGHTLPRYAEPPQALSARRTRLRIGEEGGGHKW